MDTNAVGAAAGLLKPPPRVAFRYLKNGMLLKVLRERNFLDHVCFSGNLHRLIPQSDPAFRASSLSADVFPIAHLPNRISETVTSTDPFKNGAFPAGN